MNAWQWAAILTGAMLLPCADMCLRGTPERRLVGLEMTGVLIILTLVMFTIGCGRPILMDLPLSASVMSFGGGLVFVRFLEKHL